MLGDNYLVDQVHDRALCVWQGCHGAPSFVACVLGCVFDCRR